MLKIIPGYKPYAADKLGNIWNTKFDRKLKGSLDRYGYLIVHLCFEGRKKERLVKVHRLVGLAFHGKPQPSQITRHLDGNKLNNLPSNLRWGTHKENEQDKTRHGRKQVGDNSSHHKLYSYDVAKIKQRLLSGESSRRIAGDFGVGLSTINHIKHGRTWKEVLI